MNNNTEKEVLDFCRAKKIFEKGFGFLTSLYHKENVFFHFSKIKNEEKRESLKSLKRGVVSVFYTSKKMNGKRKVDKVWLDVGEIPNYLLPDFIERLILELNIGNTNPYETIDAFNQLRESKLLTEKNYRELLCSLKIKNNPSILLKIISENETNLLYELEVIIKEWKNKFQIKEEYEEVLMKKISDNHIKIFS